MVEVNEATVEEAIKYGHFLKRSEEDIAEAIDIYKAPATRHSTVQKTKTQWTSRINQSNDYLPNMFQNSISPLYIPLHIDSWIVSPLLNGKRPAPLSPLHLTIIKTTTHYMTLVPMPA